ncbi:MAG: hypothetical protein GX340_00270, partial [Clostridiales bacterium]|nr:hypothetical protein [Clostridiales bacterium]
MSRKRKQYYVSQFDFKNIKEKDGCLYFTEEDRVTYPNSENHLFDLIYRLVGKEYNNKTQNTIPEMFILKAYGMDEGDDKEVAKYAKAVKEGIYIYGVKYVYSQKSSSMIRTQKSVYIIDSLQQQLEEHIMLGTTINKAVLSRLLSYKGLLMSSSYLMPHIPRIVVIDDYEKEVIEDVKVVLPYKITDQDKIDFQGILEEKKRENDRFEEYKEKCKEINELFTQEYLKDNFTIIRGISTSKSRSAWTRDGKRVKVEE